MKNYFDNEKKKVNLQFFDFPRRVHLAIDFIHRVRFCPAKLSVTWQSRGIFLCIPFLAIVVQSVTTDSDAFLSLPVELNSE